MTISVLVNGNMDPQQALESCKALEPTDVLVLMYVDGKLSMRSSKMTNKDALWMLECAKLQVLSELLHA